jgi:hypothetical protein
MTEVAAESGIGAWASDDLAATARRSYGVGADAELPPPVRLLSAVARLARTRQAIANNVGDPVFPAVFLLRPLPPANLAGRANQIPMVDNGLEPITGRLWFVNEAVFEGRSIELEVMADADLFSLVTDEAGCADVPAVLYDPRPNPPTLRFYRSGLGHPNDCLVLPAGLGQVIDLDRVFEVIDQIHRNVLITPDAQDDVGRLWADAPRGWPAERAEQIVQMHLRTGLSIAFPTCTVRKEQSGVPGRLDLHIEQRDEGNTGQVTVFAVLELKVLRSHRSTGTAVSDAEGLEWIDKGVRQAAMYRDDRNALAAALCCFDMRREITGEACFEPVRELSARLAVSLRVWYLFASSEAYRKFATS